MTDREKLELAAKAVSYNPETGSLVWLKKSLSVKDAARLLVAAEIGKAMP